MSDHIPPGTKPTGTSKERYTLLHEPRQHWAWAVTDRGGPTVARCNSKDAAEKVANALNGAAP